MRTSSERLQVLQQQSLRSFALDLQGQYQGSGLDFVVRGCDIIARVIDPERLARFWSIHGKSDSQILRSLLARGSTSHAIPVVTLDDEPFSHVAHIARQTMGDADRDIAIGLVAGPLLEAGASYNRTRDGAVCIGTGIYRFRAWVHLLVSGMKWKENRDPRSAILKALPAFARTMLGREYLGLHSPLPDWAILDSVAASSGIAYREMTFWAELFVILHEAAHILLHEPGQPPGIASELEADRWAMQRLIQRSGYNRDATKSIACVFLALEMAGGNPDPQYPSAGARLRSVQAIAGKTFPLDAKSVDAFIARVRHEVSSMPSSDR